MDRRSFLVVAGLSVTGTAIVDPFAPAGVAAGANDPPAPPSLEAVRIPDWAKRVTRMAFVTLDQINPAADQGAQVCHTNALWPYYPLLRDGGQLSDADGRLLKEVVRRCHARGMKLALGLPPFPSVALVKAHPEWRIHPDDSDAATRVVPRDDDLGTRLGCNVSPWGDYLIEVCGELVERYGVDGFSFDGNYHPPLCFCPSCKVAYRTDRDRELPPRVNLDDVAYREYLVWRGERLEQHYAALQRRIKAANPDAVLMSWTVNAGRYGHFLHSPRAMPTRLNRLFDLPMQEWWLDETNFGASVAPAFGAAYVRAVTGYRPAASEAYLMSRGNPYGTDSFPPHERVTRALLAMTNGCVAAESLGWPGHRESTAAVLNEVRRREAWLTDTQPLPWGALLVSEQTRQFHAYRNIAEHFLPHVYGAFRVGLEEHLPLCLINDWDVAAESLARFKFLILPGAAALSDRQVSAIRDFVRAGGGLVATGESSLCDELGRPRRDLALADVFGVSYRGRADGPAPGDAAAEKLDENFTIALDENYWKQRVGVSTLSWGDSPLWDDPRLRTLVPEKSATFRGPQIRVSEPADGEVAARVAPAGGKQPPFPAVIARSFGAGRVVYLPACLDAALWSYSYPYQRRMLARAMAWAAASPPPIRVEAPMCVQATYWRQTVEGRQRTLVHLFNGVNTTAHHGLPVVEVPLREETIPIHGIRVRWLSGQYRAASVQPADAKLRIARQDPFDVVDLPPLDLHQILVMDDAP